jgi:3'-phosphoadenosine 5'-phosphosulfate sulfotransferase (PAPS reductase)/FAD synthetase
MKIKEPSKKITLSFSGGKDSVASWLYLRDLGHDVTCVFCDTGHEAPETYNYIETLKREHDCPLVWIQAKVRDIWKGEVPERWQSIADAPLTMETLSIIKKWFPSPTARFCTTFLKLVPFQKWILENTTADEWIASGVRAEESPKRASLEEQYFDNYMQRWRWLPIHKWTAEQVFRLHAKSDVPPNPLYKMGAARVGCDPCIMARKDELRETALRRPEVFERLAAMEDRVGSTLRKQISTFFPRKKTSASYRSLLDSVSNYAIPSADDVRRWALGAPAAHPKDGLPGFEDVPIDEWIEGEDLQAPACSSPYGLCE